MYADPHPMPSKKPLYWLALGAFAIGTEGFMIAPLLPRMAEDLSVAIATAGQLVTVFALAYALSSPVLTALTGNLERRRLLIACLGAFAVANVIAFASSGYWSLMGARILLAFAAGLYAPSANAVAGALVPPAQRGRALAIVNGGTSFAIVLGVPLGAIIGNAVGWRMTFAGVALLAAIATIGLKYGLPKGFGKGLPVATLKERIDVAKKPAVLVALLGTTLWATGCYAVYTYVASYVNTVVGTDVVPLVAVLFIWGLSAASGVYLGGRFTDKIGYRRVIIQALVVLAVSFGALAVIAQTLPKPQALLPFLIALVFWGLSAWAFIAPQMTRLIGVAGIAAAPVALSLNASFMFLGFSLGAALGAFTLSHANAGNLGWVGMFCEVGSLVVLLLSDRRKSEVAVATAA